MVRVQPAALCALVFAFALGAWAPEVRAGTEEAPEITDPAGDQLIVETVPGCAPGAGCQAATRIDILAVWIDEETATQFNVNVLLSNVPSGATTATSRYRFHATADGTEVVSEAIAAGGATNEAAAPSENVAATETDGNTLIMTIDKSIYGAAPTGLTSLFVEGHSLVPELGTEYASDRAPDSDFGMDYTFSGGTGGNGTAGDSDGDGLNDTWEVEQFGNITAQNGTGDPDGDGLNNSAEFEMGTNATNPDTDGDGLNDKEDPFPLDPSKPGGNGTGNATGNATATDTDGDGLPDDWERENFGGLNQTASGDPDSDGLDNRAEFAAGTDPNDADTDGDGLNDSTDPEPLDAGDDGDRLEMYIGAPMFAAIATLCLFALGRQF